MKLLMRVVLAIVCAVCASPVMAGWQYTQWGMSPEEVRRASGSIAIKPSEEFANYHNTKGFFIMAAPYVSGNYQFTTIFKFDNENRRLSRVQLVLGNTDQGISLLSDLSGVYGDYQEHIAGNLNIYKWRDDKNNNFIALLSSSDGKYFVIDYWPIINDSNMGL